MEVIQFGAVARHAFGKSSTKKFRNDGQVPCVIYGKNQETKHVTVNNREMSRAFKGEFRYNVVIDMNITDGDQTSTERVMAYVVERNAISQELEHIDFIRVSLDEPVKATIPLILEGSAPGVKKGGILIKKKESAKIFMAPQDFPARVMVDISKLNVGQQIQIKELKEKFGVNFVGYDDAVVVRVDKGRGMTSSDLEDEDNASAESDAPAETAEASAEG